MPSPFKIVDNIFVHRDEGGCKIVHEYVRNDDGRFMHERTLREPAA